MRKSFTLLFSTLMLLCAFGFSSIAQVSITELSPADLDMNVKPTTTDLVVEFDQDVEFTDNGGTLWIKRGTTVVKTIALVPGSANATISGNTLTVKHGLTFADGQNYLVGITSNAIEDFVGIEEIDWQFTIGDYTAPVISSSVPAQGATNVDVQADPFQLEITFDEDVNAVDGKKVWVYKSDGTIVDIIEIEDGVNTSVTGPTATIDVEGYFPDEATSYYVNIEAGAFVDASVNENAFAGIMNKTGWTFTSRNYNAPQVTATVNNITFSAATLNVTLNEAGSVWYRNELASAAAPAHPGTDPTGWTPVETDNNNAVSVSFTGLNDGVKYSVYVVAENEGGELSDRIKVDYTTLDNTPPQIIANSNVEVEVNNRTVGLELAFNEEVTHGTGNLVIRLASNNAAIRTIAAADVEFEEDNGEWIMIASFEGLESEVDYYVVIPNGFVTDLAGNAYVSDFTTTTAWAFTSGDYIVPTVVVSIAASTPPVASDNISIKFSEDVKLIDGTNMATLSSETDWFHYIALEQNNVVVPFTASYAAGGTITVDPVSNLAPNTTYTVKIRANAFEDMAGNPFSNVHTTYEVTTGDFRDADITYAPADGAVDVPQGTQPTITFSKDVFIDGEAVTEEDLADLVTLTDSDGDVDFTIEWDAETLTVTVVPDEELASEETYTLTFEYTEVEDVNEQAFADPGTSTFTMVDYIAPTVTFSHSGTVEDKAADDDLTLTFSEDVSITGNIQDYVIFRQNGPDGAPLGFTATLSGMVVTITPAADLKIDSVYYYGIGTGVASDGVNTNAAAFSTFTFAPTDPVVIGLQVAEDGYVPAIGSTGVTVTGGNLVASLTFTEAVKANPVMPANHNANLYLVGNATPVSTVAISAAAFEGSKLTITFPGVTLVSEGEYYITIDADVAVANDNNAKTFAGIEADEWTFTAADTEPPVLTGNAPTGTGVELDADVVIDVDEAVVAGTGNITITAGTADVKTIAVADAVINNTAGTITVPHADFTQYNTVYTVSVPAGAFEDEAGNESAAISWTFTTLENTPPTYVLSPAHEEDMVEAGTSTFTITFSEDVVKGPNGLRAYLYEVVDGGADIELGYVYVEQAGVTLTDNVATFNFGVELEADKDYYIVVEAGMFEDVVEPASEVEAFAGLAVGEWEFYTYDKTAPTWTVSYDELGAGMDINSDITITFNKAVDFNDATITNAQIANLFNLSVGGTPIAFTGTINEDKTVVVLENSSFVPPLSTANSGQTVSVAPVSGIKGINNNLAVSTTAVTFPIADYVAPTVTLTPGTAGGDEFTFNVSSNESGTIYWLVMEGDAVTVTAEEVMEGTAIEDYTTGDTENVTVDTDIESDSEYTVYAVAVDATGNVSTVASLTINTTDTTKPVLVEASNTFTNAGVLSLVFNEDVVPGGATAVIRLAGTLERIDEVSLTPTAVLDSLILTSSVVLTYPDDQHFIVEIAGGAVADAAGNTWDGQVGLGENAWVVGLPDRTRPELVEVDPDLTALVDLDAVFILTYSEDIQLADNYLIEIKVKTGNSGVYQDDWELFEVIEASGISVEGNVLTIDPSRDFAPLNRYELKVTVGSVIDNAGLAARYGAFNYFADWFNTKPEADVTAPVATFSPADGATGVGQTPTMTISFNEDIVLLDGTAVDMYDLETMVYVRKGEEDIAHTAIIANARDITISLGAGVVLEKGADYTYGFTADFMDAEGNEVGAQSATFTVATDAEVIMYITFDPDNDDSSEPTVVPVDQAFRIIFNGELYTYSTTPAENNIAVSNTWLQNSITLMEGSNNVPFTTSIESWTEDETVIVVTPNATLLSETGYVLTVLADRLQLGVGNNTILSDARSNDYFTEDALPPLVTALYPAHNSTAPSSATMSILFNEDVMAGTGIITVKHIHGETVLTIDASELEIEDNLVKITDLSELTVGEQYFVLVPAGVITDLSGNEWEGITENYAWQFTVSDDLAAPVVINIAPVGGNAPVNSQLRITFDRPVQLGSEGFVALYTANGIAIELIRVDDTGKFQFNADNTQVTVSIDVLEQNTRYEAEVSAGTFVLEADPTLGNAAVTRSFWTFTTEINEPPVIVSLTPADNATDVSLRTVARMVFDIDVKPGTGSITLRRADDASVVHSFDVNTGEVTFNGRVVTFSLEGLLEANSTEYYIIVPSAAITNISEVPEPFAGLEQITSWTFTTQDDGDAPELVTWSPDDIEIEGNQPVFVLEFNEPVVIAGNGNLVVTEVGTDTPVLTIPITADMVEDSVITVEYDWRTYGTLKYGTEYFVTVDGGFIEDEWENVWQGVSDITVWTFMTEDLSVSIAEVQGTGATSPMLNELVQVTGTVTAVSPGEGFFVQDDNAAWSGIWVEYGNASDLQIGDGAVVQGTVDEDSA
jgi:large repetitive protein